MKCINNQIACPCGFDCYIDEIDIVNSHISKTDPKDYCNNGIIFIDNKFKCICDKSFDTFEDTEEHVRLKRRKCMNNYLIDKETRCKICNIPFEYKYQLQKHLKTKTHIEKTNGTYKEISLHCKICNIRCLSKALMETHLKTKKHIARLEAPPLDLECKICNVKFKTQPHIKKHLETNKHQRNTVEDYIQKYIKENPEKSEIEIKRKLRLLSTDNGISEFKLLDMLNELLSINDISQSIDT